MKNLIALAAFAAFASPAGAQLNSAGSDNRWNIAGPNWYETKCGHIGFSVTHGLPYAGTWRKPCSVPIRVCEYKTMTANFPADPDVPCEKMMSPTTAGPVQRTYLKTWN